MHLVLVCSNCMRCLLCVCVCVCVRACVWFCLSACVNVCTMTDCVCMDLRLPLVKHMVPKLVGLAKQLGKVHEAGLVHQAVHHHFVLAGQEGKWQFAELEKAAPNDSSLDKSE